MVSGLGDTKNVLKSHESKKKTHRLLARKKVLLSLVGFSIQKRVGAEMVDAHAL